MKIDYSISLVISLIMCHYRRYRTSKPFKVHGLWTVSLYELMQYLNNKGDFSILSFLNFPAVVNSLAIGIDSNILCLFGTVYLSSAITLVTLKKYTGLVQNSTLW